MTYLPPTEEVALDQAARKAKLGYDQQAAYSAYQQNQNNQAYQSQRAKAVDSYGQQRQRLGGGYARRGLFNSGIHQQGLSDFNVAQVQGLGDLDQAHYSQQGASTLADNQNYDVYQQTLADIKQQRQARLLQLASQLSSLKGSM